MMGDKFWVFEGNNINPSANLNKLLSAVGIGQRYSFPVALCFNGYMIFQLWVLCIIGVCRSWISLLLDMMLAFSEFIL